MNRWMWGVLALGVLMASCSTGSQMKKPKVTADQFYQKGDYTQALAMWQDDLEVCAKKNMVDNCPANTPAAFAYMKLGNDEKAIELLKRAAYTNTAPDSAYMALADIYHRQDNLSLEMLALQDYVSHFPQGRELDMVNSRLFTIYIKSQNWESADAAWATLSPAYQEDKEYLHGYFTINQALNNDVVCDSIAERLLEINGNDILALSWLGKKYYRLAEEAYQSEMKAYAENKTRKQYAKLLKALDQITLTYQTSLKYFSTLYKLVPEPATANYLSHIYNRLSDKKKAEYYGKLAEK